MKSLPNLVVQPCWVFNMLRVTVSSGCIYHGLRDHAHVCSGQMLRIRHHGAHTIGKPLKVHVGVPCGGTNGTRRPSVWCNVFVCLPVCQGRQRHTSPGINVQFIPISV